MSFNDWLAEKIRQSGGPGVIPAPVFTHPQTPMRGGPGEALLAAILSHAPVPSQGGVGPLPPPGNDTVIGQTANLQGWSPPPIAPGHAPPLDPKVMAAFLASMMARGGNIGAPPNNMVVEQDPYAGQYDPGALQTGGTTAGGVEPPGGVSGSVVPEVVASGAGTAWDAAPKSVTGAIKDVAALGAGPQHDVALDMMEEAYTQAKTGSMTNNLNFGSVLYQGGVGNVQNWAISDDVQKQRVVNAFEQGYDLYADLDQPGPPGTPKKHVLVAHIEPGREAVLAMFYEDMEKGSHGTIDAFVNNLMFGAATDPFTFITYLGPAAHAITGAAEAVEVGTAGSRAAEAGSTAADVLRTVGKSAEVVEQAQHVPGALAVGAVKTTGRVLEKVPPIGRVAAWARELAPADKIRLVLDMSNERVRQLAESAPSNETISSYLTEPPSPTVGVDLGGPGPGTSGSALGEVIEVGGKRGTVVEQAQGYTVAQAEDGGFFLVGPGNVPVEGAAYPRIEEARRAASQLATRAKQGPIVTNPATKGGDVQGIADEAQSIIDSGVPPTDEQATALLARLDATAPAEEQVDDLTTRSSALGGEPGISAQEPTHAAQSVDRPTTLFIDLSKGGERSVVGPSGPGGTPTTFSVVSPNGLHFSNFNTLEEAESYAASRLPVPRFAEDVSAEIDDAESELRDFNEELARATDEGDPDAISAAKEDIKDTKRTIAALKKEMKGLPNRPAPAEELPPASEAGTPAQEPPPPVVQPEPMIPVENPQTAGPPIATPKNIGEIFRPETNPDRIIGRVHQIGQEGNPAAQTFWDAYGPKFEENYNAKGGIKDWDLRTEEQTEHLTSLRNATPEQKARWFNPDGKTLTAEGTAESARRKAMTEAYQSRAVKVRDYVDQADSYRNAGLGEPPSYEPAWIDPNTVDDPLSKGTDRRFVRAERDEATGKITNRAEIAKQWQQGPSGRPDVRNLFETAVTTTDGQLATDIRYALRSSKYGQYRKLADDARALRERLYGEDSILRTADRTALDKAQADEAIKDKVISGAVEHDAPADAVPPWMGGQEEVVAKPPVTEPWAGEPEPKRFAKGLWVRAKAKNTEEAGVAVFAEAARRNPKWKSRLMVGDDSEVAKFRRAWRGQAQPPSGTTIEINATSSGAQQTGNTIGGLTPAKATLEFGADDDRLLRAARTGGISGDYTKLKAGDLEGAFPDDPNGRLLFDKVDVGGKRVKDPVTGKWILEGQTNDERLGDIFFRHLDEILEGGALTDPAEIKAAAVRATMADLSPNIPMAQRSRMGRSLSMISSVGKENTMYSIPKTPVRLVGDNVGNFFTFVSNGKTAAAGEMVKDLFRKNSAFRAGFRGARGSGVEALAHTGVADDARAFGLVVPDALQRGFVAGREEVGRGTGKTVLNEWLQKKWGDPGKGIGIALTATGMAGSDIGKQLVIGGDQVGRSALWRMELRDALPEEYARLTDEIESVAGRSDVADAGHLIDGLGGAFSPEDIRRLAPEAGFTQGEAEHLARTWRGGVTRASKLADAEEKRLLFDYRSTNLDDALKKVTFFHYWMSRASPLYLETALRNPALLGTYVRMKDELQRQCDRRAGQQCGYLKMFGSDGGFGGWFNPLFLISSTFIAFEPDFQNPDARGIDRLINAVPVMMAPLLQSAISAVGWSSRSDVDPLMTLAGRRMLTGLINFAKQEGWYGDKSIAVDPTPEFIGGIYAATSAIAEKYHTPFSERVVQKIGNRNDLAMMANAVQDAVLSAHGLDVTTNLDDLAKTPQGQAIIEEITNGQTAVWSGSEQYPIANKVRKDWAEANMKRVAGSSFFSGVTLGANTLDTRRALSQSAGPAATAGLQDPTGSQLDLINASGPTSLALETQGDVYRGLGTATGQNVKDTYTTIVYHPEQIEGGIMVGGRLVRDYDLRGMSEDERKLIAAEWLAGEPELSAARQDVFARQDAFQLESGNADYTAYLAWADTARNKVGMDNLMAVSPAYKRYIENLPKEIRDDPDRLAAVAFSPDAFQITNGDRPSLYSDKPDTPTDPSRVNPVDFLAKNAGVDEHKPTTTDPGLQLITDIQKYTTESAFFDLTLQQMYGNQDIHWESMVPAYQQSIRTHLAEMGVSPPSKPGSITRYESWAWARTQQGLPSGITDYADWARTTKEYLTSKGIDFDTFMALAATGNYQLAVDQPIFLGQAPPQTP